MSYCFCVRSVFLKLLLSALQNKFVVYTSCIHVYHLVSCIPHNSTVVLTVSWLGTAPWEALSAVSICDFLLFSFFLFLLMSKSCRSLQVFLTFVRVRIFFPPYCSCLINEVRLILQLVNCQFLNYLRHPYCCPKLFHSVVWLWTAFPHLAFWGL